MRVGIVGAGLLGAGIAVELASRGVGVDLFEKRPACLTQASRQNEGKVHLGFVYAHDPTLASARLMARGAFCFGPLVCRWLGVDALPVARSSPFHYVVHRRGLRRAGDLAAFYARVAGFGADEAARGGRYVDGGATPSVRRLAAREAQAVAEGPDVEAVFETTELAVDPQPLADGLRARLEAEPRIAVYLSAAVTAIRPDHDGVSLEVDGAEGPRRERYDHVVNAAWEDLLHLDGTAGIAPAGPWSYRLKRYLRIGPEAAGEVPSVTIALGPFGDVVRYDTGDVFLSWYPAGCTGLSTALRHPGADEPLGAAESRGLRTAIHAGLAALVPALRAWPRERLDAAAIEGGLILASGTTDVDDPSSGLHRRSRVGPRSFGRYHTVDTGKWTTAPLFAHDVACRIAGDA